MLQLQVTRVKSDKLKMGNNQHIMNSSTQNKEISELTKKLNFIAANHDKGTFC